MSLTCVCSPVRSVCLRCVVRIVVLCLAMVMQL